MLREFNFLRKLGKLKTPSPTYLYSLKTRNKNSLTQCFRPCLGEGSFGNVYLVRRISDG